MYQIIKFKNIYNFELYVDGLVQDWSKHLLIHGSYRSLVLNHGWNTVDQTMTFKKFRNQNRLVHLLAVYCDFSMYDIVINVLCSDWVNK